MSQSPEKGDAQEWHEAASVTVTRLVCQALVTLIVLGFSVFLILTHPEWAAGVALVCGVVLGSWFAIPAEFRRPHRRRKDAEES